jgi:hypothetical protein
MSLTGLHLRPTRSSDLILLGIISFPFFWLFLSFFNYNATKLKSRGKDSNLAVMPELISDATYEGWLKQQFRLLLGASYPQLLRLVELPGSST